MSIQSTLSPSVEMDADELPARHDSTKYGSQLPSSSSELGTTVMICSSRVIVRDPRKFNRDVEYIFTLDDAEETVESIERKQQDGEDSQREIPIETLEEIPQNVRRTLARLTGSDWQSLTAASDLP